VTTAPAARSRGSLTFRSTRRSTQTPRLLARGGLLAPAQITGVADHDLFDWGRRQVHFPPADPLHDPGNPEHQQRAELARAAIRSIRSPGTILAGDGGTGAAIVWVGGQDTSAGMMAVEMRPGACAASAAADAAQELICSAIRGVRTALSSAPDGGDVGLQRRIGPLVVGGVVTDHADDRRVRGGRCGSGPGHCPDPAPGAPAWRRAARRCGVAIGGPAGDSFEQGQD
jgi:hypothetical protein